MYHPLVAIIGRANVGKSTLFNRLLSAPLAITDAQAGTTRDINIANLEWRGKNFWLADSAGLEAVTEHSTLRASIKKQHTKLAGDADLLLWVIDGQVNLTPTDRRISRLLKPYWSKLLMVVNKIDNPGLRKKLTNNKILGLPTSLVSSKNGSGTGDLLDEITKRLTKSAVIPEAVSIVVAGKPNVGKSSLVNAIIGEERSLVDPTPHTTRDSQHNWLSRRQVNWCLVDTAGIRRQSSQAAAVEAKSVRQTLNNLDKGQVIFLVLDAGSNFSWQDQRLGELVDTTGKPVIILVNKMDLLTKPDEAVKKLPTTIGHYLPMLNWAKIKFVSATTQSGLANLLKEAADIHRRWQHQITATEEERVWKNLPKSFGPQPIRLLKLTQTKTMPPEFEIVLGSRLPAPKAIKYMIAKIIRQTLPIFKNVPLRVAVRTKAGV